MAHLYKFTCKPNLPVVSKATLVVWTPHLLDYMGIVLAAMAAEAGFTWAHGNADAEYLGELKLSGIAEMYPDGIICSISGEY